MHCETSGEAVYEKRQLTKLLFQIGAVILKMVKVCEEVLMSLCITDTLKISEKALAGSAGLGLDFLSSI